MIISGILRLINLMLQSIALLRRLESKIDRILVAIEPLPATRLVFTVEKEGEITEGVTSMTMTNSQKVHVTIQPVDRQNNPATVDGVPVWASSDETIITVTPIASGMEADVVAVGPLGTAKVSVSADADLGAGVTTIFGSLEVIITQGQAVGINITTGTPTEQ